jgi:glycosyltransferase 2 family protein
MGRVLAVLRSPWVRRGFVLAAVAAAVWAVASQWEQVREAIASLPLGTVLLGLLASIVYVVLTMLSWRAVLKDLGSGLPLRNAARLFFVSQVAKYLPGGVWNIVAAAEMGADQAIPRRRSVSGMVVALLVSIVTGLLLAVVAIAFAPGAAVASYGWVAWTFPLFLLLLAPPVLNRLLALALRLTRRPPLEQPLSVRGVVVSSAWALAGWIVAGMQVWLIATALGMDTGIETLAQAVGAYALAWTVGFLVVVVPAGVGVREAVLGAMLAGLLDGGAVVVTVLLSRLLLTAADLLLGLLAAADLRVGSRAHARGVPGSDAEA